MTIYRKRILITGAAGMLGQAVAVEFQRRGDEVLPLTRRELDITDFAAVRSALWHFRPHVVVNCAAYTNVDGAEGDYRQALLVNGLGPRHLALACREMDADLVHISTDYIFDGSNPVPYGIFDPPDPINAYGRSKLWGEQSVAAAGGRYYIVRTSWLFGPGGKNFVDTILRTGREKGEARVVNDQRGCPTCTVDLARALADLAATGCYGTYHVTNSGSTTWYDFAAASLAMAGFKVRLSPCTTAEFPRPAKRPACSMLDPFPLKETIGYLLPPWEDALQRYLSRVT
ncbi:dTDP-4-dehydrorhamnose reductase [Desulfofundulus thermobenzoicus]|uniref:dTDP-4-dehydrorhamnose reductase n=1 Tax=Desulfofundulus thermobenzoicus TaxID=29376 RepID=A0A6N7IVD8_9FIRM|nr:dTDP-4-dehydrorhamnose reductase [Desulfofundulus thermobenzoicus]